MPVVEFTKNKKDIHAEIKKRIFAIIPRGYPQHNYKEGQFRFDTFWKKGELKKVDLDGEEISKRVNMPVVQDNFEKILLNGKRFRQHFTGRQEFTVTLLHGEINKLYWREGNYIINNTPSQIRREYAKS